MDNNDGDIMSNKSFEKFTLNSDSDEDVEEVESEDSESPLKLPPHFSLVDHPMELPPHRPKEELTCIDLTVTPSPVMESTVYLNIGWRLMFSNGWKTSSIQCRDS